MELIPWIQKNDQLIDWSMFADPWDHMQRRHNPFRDEQIEVLLRAAAACDDESPSILDLGCGPGILGRELLRLLPNAHYFGADCDPLMLAAMQRLLPKGHVHPMLIDLRNCGWMLAYLNSFDAVVSLTALHWLSQVHLNQLYCGLHKIIKPGGLMLVGDPYVPENPVDRERFQALQAQMASAEKGSTWNEFWQVFFERYPVKAAYSAYHHSHANQEPFEGSDDGYSLEFYTQAMTQAGFENAQVYWMKGLRVVYGGTASEVKLPIQ